MFFIKKKVAKRLSVLATLDDNLAILRCNFRAVSEAEHHCTVLADRDPVYDRQPQLIVKLSDSERAFFDVADEAFEDFGLSEPFPLLRFQLVDPLRRLAVAFEVAVIPLAPFVLVDYGSGVLIYRFTGEFGHDLNLAMQFSEFGVNRRSVAENGLRQSAILNQGVPVVHQRIESGEETRLDVIFGYVRSTAALARLVLPLVFIVTPPDFTAVGLIALITAPYFFAVPTAAVGADDTSGEYARAACRPADGAAALNLKLNGVELVRFDNGGVAFLDIVLLNLPRVLHHLFREEILAEGLLQKRMTFVLLVAQNRPYHGGLPCFLARRGRDAAVT